MAEVERWCEAEDAKSIYWCTDNEAVKAFMNLATGWMRYRPVTAPD